MSFSLRMFLSRWQERLFKRGGAHVIDRQVTDPLLDERMQRIQAQLTAAFALHEILEEVGDPVPRDLFDLSILVLRARRSGVIEWDQVRVFTEINRLANEAKHRLSFMSRL